MPSSRYSFRRNRFAPEVPTRIPPRATRSQFAPLIHVANLDTPREARFTRKNFAPMLASPVNARKKSRSRTALAGFRGHAFGLGIVLVAAGAYLTRPELEPVGDCGRTADSHRGLQSPGEVRHRAKSDLHRQRSHHVGIGRLADLHDYGDPQASRFAAGSAALRHRPVDHEHPGFRAVVLEARRRRSAGPRPPHGPPR